MVVVSLVHAYLKIHTEVEDKQLDHDCHQMLLEFHLFMAVFEI
jgi:hypothetical protein